MDLCVCSKKWALECTWMVLTQWVPVGRNNMHIRCTDWSLRSVKMVSTTCVFAARNGRLEVLKWCRQNECPWFKWTCAGSEAALHGHLEIIQWCRQNGCLCKNIAYIGGILEYDSESDYWYMVLNVFSSTHLHLSIDLSPSLLFIPSKWTRWTFITYCHRFISGVDLNTNAQSKMGAILKIKVIVNMKVVDLWCGIRQIQSL